MSNHMHAPGLKRKTIGKKKTIIQWLMLSSSSIEKEAPLVGQKGIPLSPVVERLIFT